MASEWALIISALPALGQGTVLTLLIGLVSGIAAMLLGAVLAAFGMARFRLLRLLAAGYIDIMRGLPPLVLILIAFYVLPQFGLMLQPTATGTVALGLYYAAYVAEVMRGAMQAVPLGQAEAGLVIGMTRRQIACRIIIPQALALMIPSLSGLLIGLVKESALLSIISVSELTFRAKQVVSDTYAPFEIYAIAALIYWAITAVIDVAMRLLEARMRRFQLAMPTTNDRGGRS